jgi:D-amino-acid dehydrogenase
VEPLEGGVYFQNEACAEPLGVVLALKKECELKGVKFLSSEKVIGLKESSSGKVSCVRTERREFEADEFVFATGSWSNGLSKILKMNIPILGGKGYSLIFEKPKAQPQVPLMFIEKKIAVTPRENSLRIAGTLELVDQDFSITERRVQAIIKGARQYLDLPENLKILETWRGLRPCTPDGLPMIGRSSVFTNVFLNFGHQMLGLQSGLGSGELLAKLIDSKNQSLSEADSLHLRKLDPMRF